LQDQIDEIELLPGPQGPAGPSQTLVVTERTSERITANPGNFASGAAECLSGEVATGGGWDLETGASAGTSFAIESMGSTSDWRVFIFNEGPNPKDFTVKVMCAKLI